MKTSISELFENLLPNPEFGYRGLLKTIFALENEEQSLAKAELLSKACLYNLKRADYSGDSVLYFPRFDSDLGSAAYPFWAGGLELWQSVFKEENKRLLESEVDLEIIKMLP